MRETMGQKNSIFSDDSGYNGEDMMFYWISGSPACFRAMIALGEKNITGYPQKHLSFMDNEHKSEEVLKWNPRGQVPTFVHQGQAINESMAICQYIQNQYPDRGTCLVSQGTTNYRHMLQRQYEAQNLQKRCEDIVYYKRGKSEAEIDKEELRRREASLFDEVKLWDSYLNKLGEGSYLSGKEFSLADLAFYPYLAFSVQHGLVLGERLPTLEAYYQLTTRRDAVQKAWPDYWKQPLPNDQKFFMHV